MNYYPHVYPMYYGSYQQYPVYHTQPTNGSPYQQNIPKQTYSTKPNQTPTGNICAPIDNQPVYYQPLNIKHWPSEDYKKPHPKGFLHTLHHKQYLGQHIPDRSAD